MTPRALGGSGEADNLRVLCRAHNRDAAERVFGRAHVEARIRSLRKGPSLRGDGSTPFSGPADFSQRTSEATRVGTLLAIDRKKCEWQRRQQAQGPSAEGLREGTGIALR
ncbi:hypothetical protein [Labilithrix luteola]|uniref:hypothetical protein n=1 Tax=Labilithrix luteola TaxID=1391654 RepID=UPI003B835EF0